MGDLDYCPQCGHPAAAHHVILLMPAVEVRACHVEACECEVTR